MLNLFAFTGQASFGPGTSILAVAKKNAAEASLQAFRNAANRMAEENFFASLAR